MKDKTADFLLLRIFNFGKELWNEEPIVKIVLF